MGSVNAEQVAGGYLISRHFSNPAAAQRAIDLLLTIDEAAYEAWTAVCCPRADVNTPCACTGD